MTFRFLNIQLNHCKVQPWIQQHWKTYKALTTETVLLIDATINCWKLKVNEDLYHKVSSLI